MHARLVVIAQALGGLSTRVLKPARVRFLAMCSHLLNRAAALHPLQLVAARLQLAPQLGLLCDGHLPRHTAYAPEQRRASSHRMAFGSHSGQRLAWRACRRVPPPSRAHRRAARTSLPVASSARLESCTLFRLWSSSEAFSAFAWLPACCHAASAAVDRSRSRSSSTSLSDSSIACSNPRTVDQPAACTVCRGPVGVHVGVPARDN